MSKEIVFRRPVDGASYLYDKGLKVFPIIPNQKEPSVKAWQEWALTADLKRIEQTAKANPLLNWGVFASGSGLFVLDIDTKEGRKGLESLKALEQAHGPLPNTFTVRTATGGLHRYYYGDGKNSAGSLGPGLDTRGQGGYVVAPGSRIDERSYEVVSDDEIAHAPAWLIELVGKFKAPEVLKEGALIPEGNRNALLTSFAGTMRRRGMGYDAILAALEVVNEEQSEHPISSVEVQHIARSICKYAPEQADVASDFLDITPVIAMRASEIDEDKIPARDWVMDHRYMAGFLSVVVSPGGVGKSMLTMLDAISVASGRELTGFKTIKQGAVWILNLEDPMDELKRRMAAPCLHYGIPLKTLDNIFISSGQDHPFIVAKKGQDGIVINQTAVDNAIEFIRSNGIVLMLVDPFVRSHECEENDNMQMDKVAWIFSRIAVKAGCAIGAIHHASKAGSSLGPGDMNSARGASALVNASRIAHTITTMTPKEAQKFAVAHERRGWYFRFDNAKANMQPPAERADWFERKSVILSNGDSVGVIERVNMKEIKKEKETEQESAEVTDLSDCLYELMKPGDQFAIEDTLNLVLSSAKYKHLFAGYNARYSRDKLMNLLNKTGSVRNKGKEFTMHFNPDRRPKYLICCTEFDVQAALVEALK